MTSVTAHAPRCAVLVGPYTSGKTTLLEALLHHCGAIHRKGSIAAGNTVGDSTPEARARQMSVEPNFASAEYLGELWSFIDCPGSVELMQDAQAALMAADVAVIVAEPDPARAVTLAPIFKFLDDFRIPHLLFVNKMDKAQARVRDLLEALQAVSSRPLVLRQVPIRDGEEVTGFVDLASERAYRFKENQPSDLIEMPDTVKDREGEARQEMLESLADFDDGLLEQLLEDKTPAAGEIFEHFTRDLAEDLIVPVLLGSAEQGNGIQRLFKALRHDAPGPDKTAERLGVPHGNGFAASIVKTLYQAHSGKLSIARVWRGTVKDNSVLGEDRLSGIHRMLGGEFEPRQAAEAGELAGFSRLESANTGQILTDAGPQERGEMLWPDPLKPVYALAVEPKNRQDEVKLTTSIAKLTNEDPSISMQQDSDSHQLLLWGQGEIHLKLAAERLKSRFNVEVVLSPPRTAYKESITKSVQQHARHKKQSGGHGQFGDVQIEIKPLPRGSGFEFTNAIVGGAIPKQYIPSVETGIKEYLARGPLGFPVVDVAVKLFDGQFHAVDSSDQAFKTAGRQAMAEGMPNCGPILLEPIYKVTISVPNSFTSGIHGLISGRRGQILGFEAKPGWQGWDDLHCYLPQAELSDLIVEIRSLTLGVGTFDAQYERLQELTGKQAERIIAEARQEATP